MVDGKLGQERVSTRDTGVLVFEKKPTGKRPLWNVTDVAVYLCVSTRTVQDWVFKKLIPYRKVGRCVRFDPDVIERWTLQE